VCEFFVCLFVGIDVMFHMCVCVCIYVYICIASKQECKQEIVSVRAR
jgi:hypothetical protein